MSDLSTLGPAPKRKASTGVEAAGGNSVKAPMQASVVKIAVEEGQKVTKGELVIVLEAMKMEQQVPAPRDGFVRNINAEVGTTVSNGHLLLTIEDE
jgi:acetyl-CoA/propionyl-CoA carboxylase biotin carboxyl carrier protein